MCASRINPNEKSKRGRPKVDSEQVGIRFSVETIAQIDSWRRTQPDMPIRTEAIRRLVELGLGRKNES